MWAEAHSKALAVLINDRLHIGRSRDFLERPGPNVRIPALAVLWHECYELDPLRDEKIQNESFRDRD